MSITLSKVTYENIGSISCRMAEFLDTLAPDETPSRTWLHQDDHSGHVQKLKDFAVKSPEDASAVETILEELNKTGEIDLVWG